jgi:hypothetical protein
LVCIYSRRDPQVCLARIQTSRISPSLSRTSGPRTSPSRVGLSIPNRSPRSWSSWSRADEHDRVSLSAARLGLKRQRRGISASRPIERVRLSFASRGGTRGTRRITPRNWPRRQSRRQSRRPWGMSRLLMGMGMGVRDGRGGMRSCRRQVRYIGVGVVSR